MPCASIRFRSASCVSFWSTNFICSDSCSRRSFSWIAFATIVRQPDLPQQDGLGNDAAASAVFRKSSSVSLAIRSRSAE